MDETATLRRYQALRQMVDCGAWDALKAEILEMDKSLRDKIYHEMAHKPESVTTRTAIRNAGKLCAYEEIIDFVEKSVRDGEKLTERIARRDNH